MNFWAPDGHSGGVLDTVLGTRDKMAAMNWLKKLFALPGDDLRKGQVVQILGEGPVTVTNPRPRGPHSSVFEAQRHGGQPSMYERCEIE